MSVRIDQDAVLAETRTKYPRCPRCDHEWHGVKCIQAVANWSSGHVTWCQCATSQGGGFGD